MVLAATTDFSVGHTRAGQKIKKDSLELLFPFKSGPRFIKEILGGWHQKPTKVLLELAENPALIPASIFLHTLFIYKDPPLRRWESEALIESVPRIRVALRHKILTRTRPNLLRNGGC